MTAPVATERASAPVAPAAPAAPVVPDSPVEALAFRAAGRDLALPATAVERVLEVPDTQRVPGTPHWFAGLAVLAGRLLPVTDLGAWLRAVADRSPTASDVADVPAPAAPSSDPGHVEVSGAAGSPDASARRLLELAAPFGPVGLLVDRVHGLRAPDATDAPDAPDATDAPVEGGTEMLDPDELTGSADFVSLVPPKERS